MDRYRQIHRGNGRMLDEPWAYRACGDGSSLLSNVENLIWLPSLAVNSGKFQWRESLPLSSVGALGPWGLKGILHLGFSAMSRFWILVWQEFRWQPHIVWLVEPPFLMAPRALITGLLARCRTWLHVQDFEIDEAFDLDILDLRRSRSPGRAMNNAIARLCF